MKNIYVYFCPTHVEFLALTLNIRSPMCKQEGVQHKKSHVTIHKIDVRRESSIHQNTLLKKF